MSADRPKSQDFRLGKDTASASQNAALRGAALAFGKPPMKPKPKTNTYSGNNGALAAATKVGTGSSSQQTPSGSNSIPSPSGTKKKRAVRHDTDSAGEGGLQGGSPERNVVQSRLSQLSRGDSFLQPGDTSTDSLRSHSFIAATLAASGSSSVSPNRTGDQPSASNDRNIQRLSNLDQRSSSSLSIRSGSEPVLDTTSIPPTTSLIGMFEQTGAASQTVRRPPVRKAQATASLKSSPPQRSPSRTSTRGRTPSPLAVTNQKSHPSPTPQSKPKSPKLLPSQSTLATIKAEYPKPPLIKPKPSLPASKPISIPKNPEPSGNENNDDDGSSADSFVSASDYQPFQSYQPSFRAALNDQKRHLTSGSAVSLNSSVTVDSLANAIVASSLASSRAASPSHSLPSSHLPPPPPPTRRNKEHRHLFHNSKEIARTPSPLKQGLRTTMREPKAKEEIDEGEKRRGRKNLVKKHPNKHHEGDRKRWRDEVSERERKRYEAVWASNKGLYTGSGEGAEKRVCNLVVRDIWQRSRLRNDVLEEVYELVNRIGKGGLEREEFVVGLWLIDQRLKGRKLPIRVSESVWKSVGSLSGIVVRKVHK